MTTYYVSIGNSDDKLSQERWHYFVLDVNRLIRNWSTHIHGNWRSPSDSPWQNACWCFESSVPDEIAVLRQRLAVAARDYEQDSIAWAECPTTEFIGPARPPTLEPRP